MAGDQGDLLCLVVGLRGQALLSQKHASGTVNTVAARLAREGDSKRNTSTEAAPKAWAASGRY